MASYTKTGLQIAIDKAVKQALDNTAKRLLTELTAIIDEVVYGGYSPTFYDRTYQFRDSWHNTLTTQVGSFISTTIEQDIAIIVHNSQNWQHGNQSSPLDPMALNEIINNGWSSSKGLLPPAGFPIMGARPFWDEFMAYLESNFYRIFQEELSKVGINFAVNASYR